MFHQVFILDNPEKERDDDILSTGTNDQKIINENGQTECDIKMEVDVQNDIPEQVDKPLKIEQEAETLPEENKEIINNEIALTTKMELVIQNETPKQLVKYLTLDVKSEINPEENAKAVKEMDPSFKITQNNEALSGNIHLNEGNSHLIDGCNEQWSNNFCDQNGIITDILNKTDGNYKNENKHLCNSKGNEVNNLLNKRYNQSTNLQIKYQEYKTICETTSGVCTKTESLSKTSLPSDTFTNYCSDEDSKKGFEQICNVNQSITQPLVPEQSEMIPLSSEESSGSDWEQEFLASKTVDVKRKHSRSLRKQNADKTLTDFSNRTKYPVKNNAPINIKPMKAYKIADLVIQPLPNSDTTSTGFSNQTKHPVKNIVPINIKPVKVYKIADLVLQPLPDTDTTSTDFSNQTKHPVKNIVPINIKPVKACKKADPVVQPLPDTDTVVNSKVMIPKLSKKININSDESKNVFFNEEEQFICKKCCKLFNTKVQMYNHARTLCFGHRRAFKFQCDICGKCFSSFSKLENHKNSHTNAKPYKCTECDKRFNSTTTRHMHYKSTHENIKSAKFMCSFCGITSKSISHMLAHEEAHRLPEGVEIPLPFKCFECGRGYVSKFKLSSHVRKSHKMLKCPQCSESFKTRTNLRIHRKDVHNVVKLYNCKSCDKVFDNLGSLKSHSSVHSALQHFCEICDKGFKLKGHLKQHMITHSNEKPLSCPDCGDCFKRKTHLNQHISAIHGKGKKR